MKKTILTWLNLFNPDTHGRVKNRKPPEKVISCMSLIISLIIISALIGCGSKKNDDGFNCPSLGDNVTWNSYGRFEFEQEGPDSTARDIISECGWHVFGGHNGGVGNTLQLASQNDEVVFVWAFNDFHAFRLIDGWEGQTEREARLGDHTTVFHNLHPEFTVVDKELSTFNSGSLKVEARFDGNGLLEQLLVGHYFRN